MKKTARSEASTIAIRVVRGYTVMIGLSNN